MMAALSFADEALLKLIDKHPSITGGITGADLGKPENRERVVEGVRSHAMSGNEQLNVCITALCKERPGKSVRQVVTTTLERIE